MGADGLGWVGGWACLQRPTLNTCPRSRPGPEHRQVFVTSPFFAFHHANAFVASDGRVVLDTVADHEGLDFSVDFDTGPGYYDSDQGRGTLTRLVLDPATGSMEQHRLLARSCEFPSGAIGRGGVAGDEREREGMHRG